MDADAVLLDIDGVLTTSWLPIDGALEALSRITSADVPFKLVTNTTTHTRAAIARTLSEAGFEHVEPDDIVTAVTGTASYLKTNHPGARVFLLSDGEAMEDLAGVDLVPAGEPAEVVAIGGASDEFSYTNLNRAFRLLMNGAALVGLHRNMYWKTTEGLELDGGAYIAGLEQATGRPAAICGKPSREFFSAALSLLGSEPARTAMVGDDIVNDVIGAQDAGLTGVLVRTGKFLPADLDKGEADHVIGSIAELPELLGIA